jgi:hypothetical protein
VCHMDARQTCDCLASQTARGVLSPQHAKTGRVDNRTWSTLATLHDRHTSNADEHGYFAANVPTLSRNQNFPQIYLYGISWDVAAMPQLRPQI